MPVLTDRPIPLPVPATHHHLESLAAEVHSNYFSKYPPLPVRWGQQISRKNRRTIRLGSYNHHTAEIRVHPILNRHTTPAFFIQSIIYHEYLHHVLGPSHNRRFHKAERQFRYHRESQEWLRRNLWALLGRKKSVLRPGVVVDLPPIAQMALF